MIGFSILSSLLKGNGDRIDPDAWPRQPLRNVDYPHHVIGIGEVWYTAAKARNCRDISPIFVMLTLDQRLPLLAVYSGCSLIGSWQIQNCLGRYQTYRSTLNLSANDNEFKLRELHAGLEKRSVVSQLRLHAYAAELTLIASDHHFS